MGATHRLLRFGVFELNLDTEELRKSGVLVKLPPQPLKLLGLIAGRSGLVVTREEIQKELWGEDTFVDFEQGMNHCIKQIRAILNDNANTPLYVETIPRRGYRFLAPVTTKTIAAPARVTESSSGIASRVPLPASAEQSRQERAEEAGAALPSSSAGAAAAAEQVASDAAPVKPISETSVSSPRFVRRIQLWAAGLATLAVIAYAAARYLRVTVEPRAKSIAVLPFEVSGEDTAFGLGLSESIAARLLQASNKHSLDMVSPREARDIGIKTAADARQRLKTDYVLEGTVEKNGTQLRVTCTLVDSRSLRSVEALTVAGQTGDLFALQDKVIAETMRILPGQSAPAHISAAIAQPPGYEAYLRGRGYLQDYQKPENIDNAIADFTHSLALDPGFAPAYAGLGQAYWMGYDSLNKGKEWLDRSRGDCQRAIELDSNLAEAHSCIGNYYNATGQYQDAAREFHAAVTLEPDNVNALRGLGKANDKLNNAEPAEAAYRKAIEVAPHYWAPYNWLAVFYYHHGRYEEAAQMYREALDRAPENQRLYYNLAGLYEETGKYDDAIQVSQVSLQKGPTAAGYTNLGNAYFYKHDFRSAEENFRKAIALDDQGYDYWGNLGDALYWSGDRRSEAAAAYSRARTLVHSKLQVNPNDAGLAAYFAYSCAMLNDRQSAMAAIQRALKIAPNDGIVLFRAAQVYNHLGDRKRTLEYVQHAIKGGYSPTMVRDSPDFAAFNNEAAFIALIAQK